MGKLLKFLIPMLLLLLVFWRRDKDEPKKALPSEVPSKQEAAEQQYALFQNWLGVLYRDRPQKLAELSAAVGEYIRDDSVDGSDDASVDNVLNFGALGELDSEYVFAVDWKDSQSFVDGVDAMAARLGAEVHWPDDWAQQLPEQLMGTAYTQLLAQQVALYNAQTDGDFYVLMAVRQQDEADLKTAAQAWGLAIRPAEQPY